MPQPTHHSEAGIRWNRALLVVLVILASLVAFTPTTAQAKSSKGRTPKIVMIGDSYSTIAPRRGCKRPWPERVRKALKIRRANCKIYRHGGYGFGKPGHRFIQLLKGVKRNPTVTDVLIVGGAGNDRRLSEEELLKWYRITIKRLRKLYPNATIMHTITSWDINNASYREKIVMNIPLYKKEAKKLGVVYLHGCAKTIRNHPEWFSADGRHPTDKGQKAMSKVIIQKIRKYNKRYAK